MLLFSSTRERFARIRVSVFILNVSNASDERAAERRHRQSQGTDAYLQEG